MSVYIKGFPMPNNCGACPLRLAWCRERIYMVTRPERCPLVPVPPHGDLISRECLIDIALHLMNTAKNDDITNGVKWLWQYIIEAPTIIEAEVTEDV